MARRLCSRCGGILAVTAGKSSAEVFRSYSGELASPSGQLMPGPGAPCARAVPARSCPVVGTPGPAPQPPKPSLAPSTSKHQEVYDFVQNYNTCCIKCIDPQGQHDVSHRQSSVQMQARMAIQSLPNDQYEHNHGRYHASREPTDAPARRRTKASQVNRLRTIPRPLSIAENERNGKCH